MPGPPGRLQPTSRFRLSGSHGLRSSAGVAAPVLPGVPCLQDSRLPGCWRDVVPRGHQQPHGGASMAAPTATPRPMRTPCTSGLFTFIVYFRRRETKGGGVLLLFPALPRDPVWPCPVPVCWLPGPGTRLPA